MLYLLYIVIALVGGLFLLARMSDTLADELSRGVEALFDFIEYRLALRAEQN